MSAGLVIARHDALFVLFLPGVDHSSRWVVCPILYERAIAGDGDRQIAVGQQRERPCSDRCGLAPPAL
jgi:hypothetical protein